MTTHARPATIIEGYHQQGKEENDDAPEDGSAGGEDVTEYAKEVNHSRVALFRQQKLCLPLY